MFISDSSPGNHILFNAQNDLIVIYKIYHQVEPQQQIVKKNYVNYPSFLNTERGDN
jgi:hypothetical protein